MQLNNTVKLLTIAPGVYWRPGIYSYLVQNGKYWYPSVRKIKAYIPEPLSVKLQILLMWALT